MARIVAAILAMMALCAPALAAEMPGDQLMPLEVLVNGAKSGAWLLLERRGVLYAPRDAFDEWRLQVPASAEAIDFRGQSFWPLAAIPGFKSRIDYSSQTVELLFSPQAFAASRLTREVVKTPVVSPVLPSLFVNYDASYSRSSFRDSAGTGDLGVLAEAGASTSLGVVTSSFVARNLLADPALGESRHLLRLETTFTHDFPSRNQTLRLGDTVTRAAFWGREVYFGGVRYGTNFALTPGFISQPLPALTGLSASPSTVELYVNDVLRQVSNVPSGPFAIDNLSGLTGSGEARIVVRDLLGRETVVVQSFFTNAQLLAAGLDDWSAEAGTIRRDLGQASDHYGPAFAAASWRRGVTNALTLEGRAEGTRDRQAFGAGAISTLPFQFLGKAALAASRADTLGNGSFWLLGVERQAANANVAVQAQGASRRFRQLGEDDSYVATKLQVAGNATYASSRAGTFGVGFAAITRHDGERVRTISGNYSIRVFQRGTLSFTVSRAVDGTNGTAAGLTFVLPLERNRLASAVAGSHGRQVDAYATASQNAGLGSDIGWRVLAGQVSDQAQGEAGAYYLGRYGSLSADASVSSRQQVARFGAGGALVFTDGRMFATRRLEQSFALVEIPGYPDVGVGIGSNVLSRTDSSGVALIPRLLPYQSNAVRIDPSELPVSAEIDTIERAAVPAWRSGVKIVFPVRAGRGALLKIQFDDGEPAPPGATLQIDGDAETFYIARRGEAFVTGLRDANRVRLKWMDRQCDFDVALPPASPDEIARVGPIACHGVSR